MNFFKGNISKLENNEIFVFGSNPEGRHGAGTAKIARMKFGAIYGQGRGIQGQSYALPTKNLTAGYTEQISARKKIIYEKEGFQSISKEQIRDNIKELYKYARKNKDKKFYIAYKNDGNNLNGYSSKEMFDLFTEGVQVPKNIVFSDTYKEMAIKKGVHKENTIDHKKDGINHINIYIKGRTKLGRMLTNLSDISTSTPEGDFRTIEGYWYFLKLKYIENVEDNELKRLNGYEAKKYGTEKLNNSKSKIPEDKYKEFQEKILKAIKAKIYNNSELKELVYQNDLQYEHYYVYQNDFVKELPEFNWLMEGITKIAEKLKEEKQQYLNYPIIIENRYKLSKEEQSQKNVFYCGRGSALGNPFTFENLEQTKAEFQVKDRDEACEKYEVYFKKKVNEEKNEAMINQLKNIYINARKEKTILTCYCKPKKCHCETIKSFLENHLINENKKKAKINKEKTINK